MTDSAAVSRSIQPDVTTLQWLALVLTPGMGPIRGHRLVQHFGGVERVFVASLTELEAAGLPAASAQSIALGKSSSLAEEEFMKARDASAELISFEDHRYPARLKEIYDPPLVLYVRGNAELLSESGLGVVGTRHPTPYGMGMAERLSNDLASRGLVIVSGMARGVDTHAHRGALNGKGKTVAVWGTGIDVPYPRDNRRIAEGIVAAGGTLVSEFPVGTFAAPQNFPIRNRIISGLSLGVLVVEAGEYSGTRITARCALEQGRDIFAVPGNVTNRNSWGPNTLIKQGAKLTATWEDVWEELPADVKLQLEANWRVESPEPTEASLFADSKLSPHEKRIYALLKPDEATQLDVIIEKLEGEISSSEIFSALFELELAGKIKPLPGKNYVKTF
ncbi:MAG TPA: DNA-processing protein DprA [Terriglobales bacterium]|jgi:DNA processing protein|nr:DNA-processing protein DprA [Terriglobales bacterium]